MSTKPEDVYEKLNSSVKREFGINKKTNNFSESLLNIMATMPIKSEFAIDESNLRLEENTELLFWQSCVKECHKKITPRTTFLGGYMLTEHTVDIDWSSCIHKCPPTKSLFAEINNELGKRIF